jgi:hypothetical protein
MGTAADFLNDQGAFAPTQASAPQSAAAQFLNAPDTSGMAPYNWSRDIANKASFGLSDLGAAVGSAAARSLRGVLQSNGNAPSFGDNFSDALAGEKQLREQYEAAHPTTDRFDSVLGLFGSMAPAAAAASAAAKATTAAAPALNLAKNVATNTALGAGAGAISGAEEAHKGQQLQGAETGAAGGAALGAAAPLLLKLGGGLIAPFIAPLTKEGQQKMAGTVLSEAAGGKPLVPEAAPLPDMKLTAGQATNNPSLMAFEQSVLQGSPVGQGAIAENTAANNAAITKAISSLGNTGNQDASAQMNSALESAQAAMKTRQRAAWRLDPEGNAYLATQPIKDAVAQYMKELPDAYRGIVPQETLDTINGMSPIVDFDNYDALRKVVGNQAASARFGAAPDLNKARIIGDIGSLIGDHLEASPGVPQDVLDRLANAKAVSREYHQVFDQPDVRKALGTDTFGFDRTPDSAIAGQFIRSGKGAPEAFTSYLTALSKAPEAARDAGMQAARDAFSSKFLDSVQNAGKDINGQQIASNAKITKFTDDYAHVINSPLFTPAQRDLIQKVQSASDMASRSSQFTRGTGSQTYSRLQGKSFLDAMLGKWATRAPAIAGGIAGAVLGHAGLGEFGELGRGAGAVVGASLGAEKISRMAEKLYEAPRENVMHILHDALSDPELAKSLQMKASAANTRLLSPRVRNYLERALVPQLASRTATALAGSDTDRTGNAP